MLFVVALSTHFSHCPSFRSVLPVQGELLVTGGADETIHIYNLRRGREEGILTQHKGAITCLEFVTPSADVAGKSSPQKKKTKKKAKKKAPTFLLSGSADAAICIWRVRDWACIHIMGGHKGAVNALAAHPSGRLALSVGRDKTLRMWDLTEGRMSFIVKLKREAR